MLTPRRGSHRSITRNANGTRPTGGASPSALQSWTRTKLLLGWLSWSVVLQIHTMFMHTLMADGLGQLLLGRAHGCSDNRAGSGSSMQGAAGSSKAAHLSMASCPSTRRRTCPEASPGQQCATLLHQLVNIQTRVKKKNLCRPPPQNKQTHPSVRESGYTHEEENHRANRNARQGQCRQCRSCCPVAVVGKQKITKSSHIRLNAGDSDSPCKKRTANTWSARPQ